MPVTKAILFDLDGTLLDTARDLGNALNHLLRAEGRRPLPYEKFRNVVSNGGNALVSLGFGTTAGNPQHDQLYHRLLDFYGENLATHTQPFSGIREVISNIHESGMQWGVVTNKPRHYSAPLMDLMNFDPPCAVLVCPDDVTHRKPHPEPMILATSQLGCSPENAIYVGDHQRDIEAGQAAGMRTVAVSYGYIEEDDDARSWNADYHIDQPLELLDLIKELKHA